MHHDWKLPSTVLAALALLTSCVGPSSVEETNRMQRNGATEANGVLAIAEVTVTDRSWVPEYQARVASLIERHGGRIIARNQSLERVEGTSSPPHGAVVLEFPSRSHFESFYNDPDYVPLRDARIAGSRTQFSVIGAFDQYSSSPQ